MVGGYVLVQNGGYKKSYEFRKVVRETATQIVLDNNNRYYKNDGEKVGQRNKLTGTFSNIIDIL